MVLPTRGARIGNIAFGLINISSAYGVGVNTAGNTSNAIINNINTGADGDAYYRTNSLNNPWVTVSNVNDVSYGNVTTAAMHLKTGGYGHPMGSNVSNVTVANLTSGTIDISTGDTTKGSAITGTLTTGDIHLSTGGASDGTLPGGTFNRGTIFMGAKGITINVNNTGYGPTTDYFFHDDAAYLGNQIFSNKIGRAHV